MKIEVRVSCTSQRRAYASVHVAIDGESSFTVSNIIVRDNAGKPQIELPISQVGGRGHTPSFAAQGRLKQAMTEALWEAFLTARADPSGKAGTERDV